MPDGVTAGASASGHEKSDASSNANAPQSRGVARMTGLDGDRGRLMAATVIFIVHPGIRRAALHPDLICRRRVHINIFVRDTGPRIRSGIARASVGNRRGRRGVIASARGLAFCALVATGRVLGAAILLLWIHDTRTGHASNSKCRGSRLPASGTGRPIEGASTPARPTARKPIWWRRLAAPVPP